MREIGWYEFWLPILSGLGQQCYHPCKDVRQHAMTYFQRSLLSPELDRSMTVDVIQECFQHVIFPLVDELLKPEIVSLDAHGMDETRMRAIALMGKIFLHHLTTLLTSKDMPILWVAILDRITRYLNSDSSDFLVCSLVSLPVC